MGKELKKMNSNEHNFNFESEYAETTASPSKTEIIQLDCIILNNQIFEFKNSVEGKVIFTLAENQPENNPNVTCEASNIAEKSMIHVPHADRGPERDRPVDERIRPGPKLKVTDNHVSLIDLERRNRRRVTNRDCARRARDRRRKLELESENRLKYLEEQNASLKKKYSELEMKYKKLMKSSKKGISSL